MAGLTIAGLRKSYGGQVVLDGIDLAAEDGAFVVIVGPSGCGKSTLLRLVAGLDEPDAGTIEIGDAPMSGLAPAERGVAMVFQSYALYPQMTVAENIGFPLRMAGEAKSEIARKVRDTADLLGLADLLDRRPGALSGGQRQRVAIGRAIVRQPRLFLFDEPLSNLDAGLRTNVRREFAQLHQRFPATTLYVTHDQSEAMALADRIVLMREGRIVQAGTPEELYREPADLFVARFFGSPAINVLPARVAEVEDRAILLRVGERNWRVPWARPAPQTGTPLQVGIRPEDLDDDTPPVRYFLPPMKVSLVEWLGGERQIVCEGAGCDLVWRTVRGEDWRANYDIQLTAAPDKLLIFDEAGARIA